MIAAVIRGVGACPRPRLSTSISRRNAVFAGRQPAPVGGSRHDDQKKNPPGCPDGLLRARPDVPPGRAHDVFAVLDPAHAAALAGGVGGVLRRAVATLGL